MVNNKVKIAVIVLICILGGIAFYILAGNKTSTLGDNNKPAEIKSRTKIVNDIDSIIGTFGIRKGWIRSLPLNDSKNKKANFWLSKEIIIPKDLTTLDLNFEISNYLKSNALNEKVIEEPKTKNIVMNIFSVDSSRQVGTLRFVYSDTVKRRAAEVCLILDSIEFYSLEQAEQIMNSGYEFSVFLPLRNDKADFQSLILNSGKDYLVEFSIGSGDDITADFKRSMGESQWKSKVLSAALNFPYASGIILKGHDRLSTFDSLVRQDFEKNDFKVFADTLFLAYERSESNVNSVIENIILKSNRGSKYLFYKVNLSPEELTLLNKKTHVLKKLGYKFYTFKEIIKRIEKTNT